MLFRQMSKTMPMVTSQNMSKGNFWSWVNMMFNRVDRSRLHKVGAERLCTEWLLKNGAAVRFTTTQPGQIHTDYNSLPSDKVPFPFKIKEVIADNSGIMEIGFHHFTNCNHIDTVKLINCVYIDDDALDRLEILAKTLKIVEIINCKNVTPAGLMNLAKLENLEKLKVADLPLVHKISAVETELRRALPDCKFDLK